MKKKEIERIAENRNRHIEALELVIKNRNRQISQLKSEREGLLQIVHMLEAVVLEGIEKRGIIEIEKDKISKGLKRGYSLTEKEGLYVLQRKEADINA